MLFYQKSEDEIVEYFKELAETIERASKVRIDEKGNRVWAMRTAKKWMLKLLQVIADLTHCSRQ